MQTVLEVRFPHRFVPFDPGRTEDVVHEQVQAPLLSFDACQQRTYLLRLQMVDLHGDAAATGCIDERSGFLDRLGPIHLGALLARRASRAIDRRSARSELDCDAARPAPRVAPATNAILPASAPPMAGLL